MTWSPVGQSEALAIEIPLHLPGFFKTGIDSPVMKDSSAVEVPSTTSASTGIFSPGTT